MEGESRGISGFDSEEVKKNKEKKCVQNTGPKSRAPEQK